MSTTTDPKHQDSTRARASSNAGAVSTEELPPVPEPPQSGEKQKVYGIALNKTTIREKYRSTAQGDVFDFALEKLQDQFREECGKDKSVLTTHIDYFVVEGSQEHEVLPVLAIAASGMHREGDSDVLSRNYTKERKHILERVVPENFRHAQHKTAAWFREVKQ